MVSLGPGDYELVTIKALKSLQQSQIICIPTKSSDNSFDKSITFKIIDKLMTEFNFNKELIPIYSPMKFKEEDWLNQVEIILNQFQKADIISFVTLGDSAIFSTIYYLLDYIRAKNEEIYQNSEVIAGVTSFSQASAKVKKPLCLGDTKLEITPLVDREVKTTKVLMRPKIGMDTSSIIESGEIYTFENLNLKDEKITKGKIEKVDKYMTLFIDF